MEKSYWLSYDLGVGGNYDKLYSWLDDHNAVPCGNNVAFFKYQYEDGKNPDDEIRGDLIKSVAPQPGNKLYLIRRKDNGLIGSFIYGKRGSTPWIGYGSKSQVGEVDQ